MGIKTATKVALRTNSLAFGWLDLEPTFAGQSEPRHALADAKSGMVL